MAGLAATALAPNLAYAQPAQSTQPPIPDWKALRTRLRGRVVLPGESEYATAKQIFNTRYDGAQPLAVVQVATADDVATAMSFALDNGLPLAARSGGHSYAGVSAATGVMIIDLRRLTGATFRDGTVTIAPATPLHTVYTELDRFGQTIPTGMCPMVGAAGLTLGGGLGFESRRHGLTCDRLLAATVVLPDGTAAEVSPATDPELFWALRGGGALVGVVTALTYATCPSSRKDLVRLVFPGEQALRCLLGWAAWLDRTEREAWAAVSLDADGKGGLRCWMQLVCPADSGFRHAMEMIWAVGVAPRKIERRTASHRETVDYLAGGGPTQPRAAFTNGSDVLTALTEPAAAAVVAALTDHSRAGGTGWVQLNPLDGAVRDVAPADSAFPWRAHTALVEWGAYEPIPHEVAVAWIAAAHQHLAPHSAGAYVNYLERGDTIARYYGANLPGLDEIRRRVDPDRRIHTGLTDPAPAVGD
ncbi:FAD-dependent oxidoreductase [Nocardia sp. CDC159]|uniref:FAD-dependent oxidoreductase n=1 Tax=Nocardia pulmonis TaxID=2951408 RepID=A0A9X2EBC1_9NOCA|nr:MULTISPECIES: FAD-dependent oxidoreductase [Nocardia]MCM6777717.1 FAD-dependent oxidoreductase [Nocardia pulmonis]MCM6790479.1 FAD-dependent oxidoreductase [Nocardia sp. CDC159]